MSTLHRKSSAFNVIEWIPAVSMSDRVAPLVAWLVARHGGAVRVNERGEIVAIIARPDAIEAMKAEAERRAAQGKRCD